MESYAEASAKWVNDLLKGVSGEKVLQDMRVYYTRNTNSGSLNECTLRTNVSVVRRRVIQELPTSSETYAKKHWKKYKKGLSTLDSLGAHDGVSNVCVEAIKTFVKLSTVQQAKELHFRDHRNHKRHSICAPFDSNENVKEAFDKLVLVPHNLHTFRVDAEENKRCTRQNKIRLLRKPKTVIDKFAGDTIIHNVQKILELPEDAPHNLTIACLLLSCGRRTAELLNCRATFTAIEGYEYGCIFRGQLKARNDIQQIQYKIPLLVSFTTFDHALQRIRIWQAQWLPISKIKKLSNKHLSIRYQGNLSRYLRKAETIDKLCGVHVSAHTLRAVYMRLVLQRFNWGTDRDKRIARYCLGHADESTSDYYDHVHLETPATLLQPKKDQYFPLTEKELIEMETLFDRR